MREEPVVLPIELDLSAFNNAMAGMKRSTTDFGSVFARTLTKAAKEGSGFKETLRSIALEMSKLALRSSLQPLEQAVGSLFGQATSGFGSSISAGLGKLFGSAQIQPFAKGGIVNKPTGFGFGGGVGVVGEAGAEAILPLARGPDGSLGLAQNSSAGGTSITFNVTSPDATSFQKSEGEISAMLARSVGRGRRKL